MSDPSLLELFRDELRTHTSALDQALGPGAKVAPLLRAAHSLKTASRIMGVGEAERLAKALEELLSRHESGPPPSAAALRLLAKAARLFAGLIELEEEALPVWENQNRARVDELCQALQRGGESEEPAPASMPLQDQSMLELFRQEVESQTGMLSEGLLALESDPSPERVEPLMRAAHSVKGASRIVGVDSAVQVSHLMEDYLVAVKEGRAAVSSDAVDVLLRGSDLLAGIAVASAGNLAPWLSERADELSELQVQLKALMQSGSALQKVDRRKREREIALPAEKAGTIDRVVRVSAARIDRLMGLAGESLVEARRLQPFADSLHKLLTRHTQLSDLLEALAHHPEELEELLAAARARAADVKSAILQRMDEFEGFVRRSEELTGRLYRETISSRMRPFGDGVKGFPRLVRDLGRKLDKQVELVIAGEDVGVDRDILEKVEAPLNHIVRNAIDHGIENAAERTSAGKPPRATIRLEARHWAGMLSITISDDGRGIDHHSVRRKLVEKKILTEEAAAALSDLQALDYLFMPGFSTAAEVTEISGRGVGLDVVQSVIQEVGGSVRVTSERGRGASFHLQLPITLSVVRAVVVEIAGEPYAFPLMRIDRIVSVPASQVRMLEGRSYFTLEGKNVGLVSGAQLLDLGGAREPEGELAVVVIGDRAHTCGITVDRFLGEHDLVVRPLDPRLGKVADISAAAIMADGQPLLILDVEDMVRSVVRMVSNLGPGQLQRLQAQPNVPRAKKQVLVVDDSITVREVERQLLENRGYSVTIAVDGMDGWQRVRSEAFDLVLTDVDMPRLDGIELVRSIKQDPRLKNLPVMIVSYRDREEDRLRGLEAGANYYLTKSNFHDETLVQAVIDLIGEPS